MLSIFGFLRKKARQRTPRQETGRAGEKAAEKFLRNHGYRIIARNVTYRQGEVDLVAQEKRSGTLCFVEVRSRATEDGREPEISPEQTVTPAKRRRVIGAAKKFLADRRAMDRPARFDVIAVRFAGEDRKRPDVRHYPGAFGVSGQLM
ncbi:MAG: YraN family protein [Planctomycetota bacterium]|nr:YraN family protein [Planctomycetota bacterium]